jgi:DNA-binding MarR family transcriptional regulator
MSKRDLPTHATTLHVRDHCLCFAAQRAARALSRRFDEAFRPLGITSWQFSLLTSLNRPEPPTISLVAEQLGMDRTTLTANLKPLTTQGYVKIAVDKQDRRSRRLQITKVGVALLAQATPIWESEHAQVDSLLSETGGKQLRSGLKALA